MDAARGLSSGVMARSCGGVGVTGYRPAKEAALAKCAKVVIGFIKLFFC